MYAPSSASTTSKLPVFVFIQGGGFNSNSNPNLNGTGLVEASDHNIIVVTFNYRVGPWGFLASTGSSSGQPYANNGLRDQRKAFDWVQKHIAQFGGDPAHVVLGGDSAGAASIALHLTAYGGRDDKLFHAAAAESVSFATLLTTTESQYQWDNFTKALRCSNSDAAKSLACLRSKTAAEIEAQNFNIPFPGQASPPLYMFQPTLDGDFVTDLTYDAFHKGKFVQVPIIVGDDTNGGTIFTPRKTSSQEQSNKFLTTQFPYLTSSQLGTLNKLYPNPNQTACPATGCWWRQVSNVYGEMRYMCPGLYISSVYANLTASNKQSRGLPPREKRASSGGTQILDVMFPRLDEKKISSVAAKSYAYRYNVEDPNQVAEGLGVPHTVEVNAIFGPGNVPGGVPASYKAGQSNAAVVGVIQAYWTSFIRSYDPNKYRADGSAKWEEYYSKTGQPQRLVFQKGGKTSMESLDDGLKARCSYLVSIGPSIKQK